jgi:hypothetical protein
MNINGSTTSVDFYPYCEFATLTALTVQVWHKPTKTLASGTVTVTRVGSKITAPLPSLTAITAKAKDLDEILIRVLNGNVLLWEYIGLWVVGSDSLEREWNGMTQTAFSGKNWTTL